MRWSKLRRLVLDRFAPDLQKRLDLQSAAYGACTCGHAWITYDGRVIANFCTRAHAIANGWEPSSSKINPMYRAQAAEFGEFSRQDAYTSCWSYVHELSIDTALAHADPLVRALAVADARVGKRRLAAIDTRSEHVLVRVVAALRRDPEASLDNLLSPPTLAA